jgi:hypothetical protein
MPTGAIDSRIGDRAGTKDEFVSRRERINRRRILSQEEVGAQPFAPEVGFKNRIRDGLFLKCSRLEMDPQNFVKEAFHRDLLEWKVDRGITMIKPNILYFKIVFKGGRKKDFFGLTKIKYLFKVGMN